MFFVFFFFIHVLLQLNIIYEYFSHVQITRKKSTQWSIICVCFWHFFERKKGIRAKKKKKRIAWESDQKECFAFFQSLNGKYKFHRISNESPLFFFVMAIYAKRITFYIEMLLFYFLVFFFCFLHSPCEFWNVNLFLSHVLMVKIR